MILSKKIIFTVTGIAVVLFISSLTILRSELQLFLKSTEKKKELVQTGDFINLNFSENWTVEITKGETCKVEFETGTDSTLKPSFENIDGTLFFKVESLMDTQKITGFAAKIIAPRIRSIKAAEGTNIKMTSFELDSLNVLLQNGATFIKENSLIKYVSIKTDDDSK